MALRLFHNASGSTIRNHTNNNRVVKYVISHPNKNMNYIKMAIICTYVLLDLSILDYSLLLRAISQYIFTIAFLCTYPTNKPFKGDIYHHVICVLMYSNLFIQNTYFITKIFCILLNVVNILLIDFESRVRLIVNEKDNKLKTLRNNISRLVSQTEEYPMINCWGESYVVSDNLLFLWSLVWCPVIFGIHFMFPDIFILDITYMLFSASIFLSTVYDVYQYLEQSLAAVI